VLMLVFSLDLCVGRVWVSFMFTVRDWVRDSVIFRVRVG
jgi:hypothetical protein